MFGNEPSMIPSVVRVRATVVLTAAYVLSDWIASKGFSWLTLYCEYERGAAGGAVDFYVHVRPSGLLGAYRLSAYAVGGVAAGADTASAIQRENVTYGAVAAAAEGFAYGPIALRGTVDAFRIAALESGVPGTPGDFGVDAEMSVER